MERLIWIENKEKFRHALAKRVIEGPFCRLGLGQKTLCGKVRENQIVLYRGGRGILTLLGTTLYGKMEEGGLRIRFGRNRVLSVIWLFWCALLLAAGVSLLFGEAFGEAYLPLSDLILALELILSAVFLALPVFLFSKKEKERLYRSLFQ